MKIIKDLGMFLIIGAVQIAMLATAFKCAEYVLSNGPHSPWTFGIAISMVVITAILCMSMEEVFKDHIKPTFGFYATIYIPFFLGFVLIEQFLAATFVAVYGLFWANTPRLGSLTNMILARLSYSGVVIIAVAVITYPY